MAHLPLYWVILIDRRRHPQLTTSLDERMQYGFVDRCFG